MPTLTPTALVETKDVQHSPGITEAGTQKCNEFLQAFFITHNELNEVASGNKADSTIIHRNNGCRRGLAVQDGHFTKIVVSFMNCQHQFFSRFIVSNNFDFTGNNKIKISGFIFFQ